MELNIENLFLSMPQRLKVDKVGDYQTTIHFDLQDKSENQHYQYTVVIAEGKCTVKIGLEGTAKCLVRTKPQHYLDLNLGKLNPQTAVMLGKVKISNISEMLKFIPLFSRFKIEEKTVEKELLKTPSRKPQQGPLQGLKVIDLTRLLPGPLGTMLLADLGAEVIKVESPNFQDYARSFPPYIGDEAAAYLAYNHSKRSLALDYNTSSGKEVLLKLIQQADVFVEQFRPGVLDKIGLGYENLLTINPRLIYVSITGYGQTGPYKDLAGHDLNYIGYAGILANNQEQAPQMPSAQIADIAGGSYMGVIGLLAALFAREKTGKGQFVDVAMMDATMPLAVNPLMWHWATGQHQAREESFLSGGLINYNIYPCKDDKYIALGTLEDKFWTKFCEIIQKPDWKNRMFPTDKNTFQAYKQELSAVFKEKPQEYWINLGKTHDLLITPIYDTSEIEQDEQVKARNMVVELSHVQLGKIKSIGVPIKFSSTEAKPSWAAPVLGEDSRNILLEAGFSETEIQELIAQNILQCA